MAQSVTSVTYLSPLLGSCTPRGDNSVQFLLPILFLTILRHSVAALDATPVAPRVNTAPGVFASSSSLFGTPNYDPELELGYGESYRVNYEGGSWTPSSFSDVASFVATEETADLEGLFYTGQATASNKGSSRDPMPGGLETDAATSAACASNSMPETKSQGHDTEAARKTVFSQYVRWLQLADSVDVLFQLAEDHGDDFNSLETTTFVAELAKRRAELRTTAAVTAVNRVLLPLTLNPNSFPTAHLSKLLSSLAFLRYRHTEAFAKANAVLKARTDHATLHTQAISDLAWAFASMGFRAPELFEKLAAVALLRFNSFSPRALSDMLWAFASHLRILPSTQEKLFEMAEPRLATETGLLFPGTLAKLCWAYAVAREPAPKLFAAASDRLELNAAAFGISELGQMLWALTLGECDLGPGAVEAAARRIVDLPKPGMTITDISALAWSLGKHGVPEGLRGDLEGALSEGLLALLPNATGGDVAGVFLGFAQGLKPTQAAADALIAAAVQRAPSLSPASLVTIASSAARMRWSAPRLLQALERRVRKAAHVLTAAQLTDIVWSDAFLRSGAPGLADVLLSQAEARPGEFASAALAQHASSLEILLIPQAAEIFRRASAAVWLAGKNLTAAVAQVDCPPGGSGAGSLSRLGACLRRTGRIQHEAFEALGFTT